ncbi:YhcG family protein [Corallococcus sp. CA049B]|uniref:PDDEXK nuclease domain-containing protein n=1 Tax=Corallococcus sp. CA049B TaxID=2316730 RepID=UPI001F292B4C|nr:PDDEXK nuclease domain-containing protein [Corallococcus sp. CA049B]
MKARIHAAQQRATLAVNRELLALYWRIGRDILVRQRRAGWGTGIVERVSADLHSAFPEMKGFSRANLMYMRAFAKAWPDEASIVQQPVGQLPWSHNLVLLTKLKTTQARLAYAARAIEHGWSRTVLSLHIEQRTLDREGKAVTNFAERLPKPRSDLARESLKDPYRFDFLTLGADANERELEDALVTHISRFLIELGAGFAYVGRQVHLEIDGRDFYLDLLFYHLRLRCYVVVELKAGEFEPEHAGKLNFYLSAVDAKMRGEHDGPSIGILLCKTKSRVIAEYALRDTNKPMGVAEYQLVQALPVRLESSLPSIEQLESEFGESPEPEIRPELHDESPSGRLAKTIAGTPRPKEAPRGKQPRQLTRRKS